VIIFMEHSSLPHVSVELVTPEREVVREDVDAVSLPTPLGEISILPGHEPYVGALAPGTLRFRRRGEDVLLAVSGGVAEIRDGHRVQILADTAERAEEIDEARAEEARKRAQELQRQARADETSFAQASALIEKELARIRVARQRRHRGHHGAARGAFPS
jgi:F-type H+-transporting ATPase subunit epsilon